MDINSVFRDHSLASKTFLSHMQRLSLDVANVSAALPAPSSLAFWWGRWSSILRKALSLSFEWLSWWLREDHSSSLRILVQCLHDTACYYLHPEWSPQRKKLCSFETSCVSPSVNGRRQKYNWHTTNKKKNPGPNK